MSGEGAVHRFAHEAMATRFEIRCVHSDRAYAQKAAHAAFALVDRIEQELSRFVGNSDVSRCNALAAGEAARVSPGTMECLLTARRLFDVTAGVFDVSLGSGFATLELAPEDSEVKSRMGGVRLDLGGIGKGHAVDRVVELLGEWDVTRALVHGGQSSVRALAPPAEDEGWELTLSAPEADEPKVLARISARHLALSASGTRKGDHVLDPRTGLPARGRAAWAALPESHPEACGSPAAFAEGFSTALLLLKPDDADALCRRHPALEAWVYQGGALVHRPPGAGPDSGRETSGPLRG